MGESVLDTLNIKVDDTQLSQIVSLVKQERERGEEITNNKFDEILEKVNIKR